MSVPLHIVSADATIWTELHSYWLNFLANHGPYAPPTAGYGEDLEQWGLVVTVVLKRDGLGPHWYKALTKKGHKKLIELGLQESY